MTFERFRSIIAKDGFTKSGVYQVGKTEIIIDTDDTAIKARWPKEFVECMAAAASHGMASAMHKGINGGQFWMIMFGDLKEECGRLLAVLVKHPDDVLDFPNSPTCKAAVLVHTIMTGMGLGAIEDPKLISDLVKNN